jgi:hypothetical protein
MSKRIYAVTVSTDSGVENWVTRLVRATNKSQAINHVARSNIAAEVASQELLVNYVMAGHPIEDVGIPVLTEVDE